MVTSIMVALGTGLRSLFLAALDEILAIALLAAATGGGAHIARVLRNIMCGTTTTVGGIDRRNELLTSKPGDR